MSPWVPYIYDINDYFGTMVKELEMQYKCRHLTLREYVVSIGTAP